MREIGIDITQQRSKSVGDIDPASVDLVVTLCAEEVCPAGFAGVRRLHWPLPDPAARGNGLEQFRDVRDELIRRITALFESERRDAVDRSPLR
jgi:arsenate reductase